MREPAMFSGDGVVVETRDSRTAFQPDGRFTYAARLIISGGKLPANGIGFDMSAEGRWSLRNGILTERFTSALVRPDRDGGRQLELLAEAMSEEATRRAPSQSDLLVADADQLVLRDRETQAVVNYKRID